MSKILAKVNKFVKSKYDHDEYNWKHNEYVTKTALKLGKVLGADLEVLEIAAKFHDIDYVSKELHTQASAKFAFKFLKGYSKAKEVKLAIMCHSVSTIKNIKNPSIEGKILFDADKMWCLTPAGIARIIAQRYLKNKSYAYIVELLKKKYLAYFTKLHFKESKKLIRKDYLLCKEFVSGFG
jgi:HD superfamily phosphodiesterase